MLVDVVARVVKRVRDVLARVVVLLVQDALVVVLVDAKMDVKVLAQILALGVRIVVNLNVGVRVRLVAGELLSNI